ncbi:MAG TPA: TetR/AcrR family transcriptional regulator [Mycobacteriales bacterium]|nr:TetR/AcrR family transcriptional regulator [Mycobacteriales bacterium]
MSSQRHIDDTEVAILDAARECVLAVGVRRTTLTDVARRAGLSRMTLYRRHPDVRSLVAEVMTREFGALLAAEDRRDLTAPDERSRLVGHTVAAVAALRANPLLGKVLDVDPELLLPYVIDRLGGTQRRAEAFFVDRVTAGQRDGSVRAAEVTVLARTLLLTTQSFVLSLGPASEGLDPGDLYRELARLLHGYLTPERAP